jgi:hypothetical protein
LTYDRHASVAKLVPEILNGVQTNERSNEETNELDTADAANADTSHEQPEEPLRLEAVVALVVELGPAEDSSDGATQQHGVEKNESANGGVRVLAKNHQSNEPDSRAAQLELSSSEISQGNANNAKGGIEGTHKGIIDIFRVFFARLKLERSVVTSEDSRETDEHLAERRVDIEVVFMLNVVASKLAETAQNGLVMGD